ncbi:hypothetical protein OIU80_00150 [Flavobacterium sp. LS1R47]|uniref:Uncharacterized protein n=1 Tax=Flavobacterium frigoritolerans TaxID=2987686 RepID=A0A9X2YXJ9_9FLAO|nr:hypothetical protein [Flavobacterium frigoritolerans]MCV9930678.1 hypothetical protein [Flavobacterium frigoritolerans]
MKKIALILGILITLSSCRKADAAPADAFALYFEAPQPINDSELDRFPDKFRGLYMNSDSTFLRINENAIRFENYNKFKIHKNQLDSLKKEYDIVDGKLITKDRIQKYDITSKGDSVMLIEKYVDTLFRFSYYNKVKRIDGKLILSKRDSIFWTLKILSVENDILRINHVLLKQDLGKLDSITAIKSQKIDSTSFVVKPTRSEFKSLLKLKSFGYEQQFKKVSK